MGLCVIIFREVACFPGIFFFFLLPITLAGMFSFSILTVCIGFLWDALQQSRILSGKKLHFFGHFGELSL
jgi:hypothetical protein